MYVRAVCAYVCVYVHPCACEVVHVCGVYVCTCMYPCVCMCVHVRLRTCMCAHLHVPHACVYVCHTSWFCDTLHQCQGQTPAMCSLRSRQRGTYSKFPFKKIPDVGAPGWLSGLKPPPLAQVMIPRSWDRALPPALCSVGGLLPFLSLCLPLPTCDLCQIK